MKISKATLDVLKNYASINTNILVREGNTLATISTGKNIFSRTTVAETFDREFAIYDLNSLLALLTLMEDTEVEFGEGSITISKDRSQFEYYYADPSIVVAAPDKTIEVDNHYSFNLSSQDVQMVMKAAAIVSAPMLSVVSKGGQVTLSVGDPSTPRSNTFRNVIGDCDKEFDCRLAIENFKIIPGDYEVTLSQKKFMYLKHKNTDIQYWLALEPSSVI
jgi:autotransporter translocation and assembly factor TamB